MSMPPETPPARTPSCCCRHGEMEAIRKACAKRGSPHLPGTVLYTSAQPCPMCSTAIMWARVDHVYYGATYEDVMENGK